ncbi:lysophospholipid acyltransferase family protein [Deferrisoma sp.]
MSRSAGPGRWIGVAAAALASPAFGLYARVGGWRRAMPAWARCCAAALGLRVERTGPEPPPGGLVVANHVGYLDILCLGATVPGRFVAKAEIDGWPFFGALARWGGTVFLDRDRPRDCRPWIDELAALLAAGERVILFPEAGVSPDGRTLGPFRPMLFEAARRAGTPVVPVAIAYTDPPDPRVWAWIDEPDLWRHLRTRFLPAGPVRAEVRLAEPLDPAAFPDRKALAEAARRAVAERLGGWAAGRRSPAEEAGKPNDS